VAVIQADLGAGERNVAQRYRGIVIGATGSWSTVEPSLVAGSPESDLESADPRAQDGIDTCRDDSIQLGGDPGATMSDEMGTFRVDIEVENPGRPGERRTVESVLVDTGAELSWLPAPVLESLGIERYARWRFRQADGSILERWTGPAFIHVAGKRATDDVVFGEPGDLVLLGSRTLEGLNFRVEPVTRRLVDAGPAPAAAA
jgi:predicted aspartyl protease